MKGEMKKTETQLISKKVKCDKQHYSSLYCLCCHFLLDKDQRGNFHCQKCGAKIGVLR